MNSPLDGLPLPLNCPHCARPLAPEPTADARQFVYRCPLHGAFWIDPEDGRLREATRA